MTVSTQIPRHIINVRSEIRTMIEVEAAQEILISLTASRMLRGDQPRHSFQQIRNTQHGPYQQVITTHFTFAGGRGLADQFLSTSEYHHFFQHVLGRSRSGSIGLLRNTLYRQECQTQHHDTQCQPDGHFKAANCDNCMSHQNCSG